MTDREVLEQVEHEIMAALEGIVGELSARSSVYKAMVIPLHTIQRHLAWIYSAERKGDIPPGQCECGKPVGHR